MALVKFLASQRTDDTLVKAKDEMCNLLSPIMLHEFCDEETELAKCHMIGGRSARTVTRTVDHLKD